MALVDQPAIATLGDEIYVQFGKIHCARRIEDYAVILPSPLAHGKYSGGCVRLFAAFETVVANSRWDHEQDTLVLAYQGVSSCVTAIAQFWEQVIPEETQGKIGRSPRIIARPDGVEIHFGPNRAHGVLPRSSFAIALSG